MKISNKEIIKNLVKETFLELKNNKDFKIPTVVHFKGAWVIPEEKHIEDQISLAACLFNVTSEKIVKSLRNPTTRKLTDKIWSQLKNTLSYNIKTVDEAKNIADEYGHHYNKAMFGYMNNRDMTMPVIIIKKGTNPYLVSGETEMLFARAFQVLPKVIVINL